MRIGEVARLELLLDGGGVLQLEVALLQAFHLLVALDARGEGVPLAGSLVIVEPLGRGASALVLIAGDATERLVAIGIVAEPAPRQDMIDLIARVVGGKAVGRDAGVAIDALEVLFLAQFVAQQFVGADGGAENFRSVFGAPILLLVARLDAVAQLGALLRALADGARQFDVDFVDRPERA